MGSTITRHFAAFISVCAMVAGQGAWAATASNGPLSNTQASAGSSPFDGALLGADAADGWPGGWEIGSSGSPIGLDYSAGAGYFTWTIEDTVGTVGDPTGADYIPGANRYDVFIYVENTGAEAWSRFDMFLSECCYRMDDVGIAAEDSGGGDILAGFDQHLPQRRIIYNFTDPVQPGEAIFVGAQIFYTMPIPVVTDGDKLFHMSPVAVPVPAAVWLFGSALGLLGWIRRRSAA